MLLFFRESLRKRRTRLERRNIPITLRPSEARPAHVPQQGKLSATDTDLTGGAQAMEPITSTDETTIEYYIEYQ